MKLSESLNDAFNQQILHEIRNSLIYMQISSYFENLQLRNIAKYFLKQSNEEKSHADKFMEHINDRSGGLVTIGEIEFSGLNLPDINSIANLYVSTEEQTSLSIEELYDLAFSGKSFIDLSFLQEMLKEQVEEEDKANEFALKLKTCKDLVLFDATMD